MKIKTAQNTEYMNEVLYELGKCYAAVNDMKNALHNFSKLLALARRISDAEGVCNAHMQLAFTYKVIKLFFSFYISTKI